MYVSLWFRAFLLTLLIEGAICTWGLSAEPKLARRLGLALFANLATHPAVWFVFPELGLSFTWTIALAEAFAFSLEALFYSLTVPQLGVRRAILLSTMANAVSWTGGLALRELTHWV